MHPEIEKLIEMALADGQVTEKEREIILRKTEKLGLDVDEVEMYLEGKISSTNLNKTSNSNNNSEKNNQTKLDINDSYIDKDDLKKVVENISNFEKRIIEIEQYYLDNFNHWINTEFLEIIKNHPKKIELDELKFLMNASSFLSGKKYQEGQISDFLNSIIKKEGFTGYFAIKGDLIDFDKYQNNNEPLFYKRLLFTKKSVYFFDGVIFDIINNRYVCSGVEFNSIKTPEIYTLNIFNCTSNNVLYKFDFTSAEWNHSHIMKNNGIKFTDKCYNLDFLGEGNTNSFNFLHLFSLNNLNKISFDEIINNINTVIDYNKFKSVIKANSLTEIQISNLQKINNYVDNVLNDFNSFISKKEFIYYYSYLTNFNRHSFSLDKFYKSLGHSVCNPDFNEDLENIINYYKYTITHIIVILELRDKLLNFYLTNNFVEANEIMLKIDNYGVFLTKFERTSIENLEKINKSLNRLNNTLIEGFSMISDSIQSLNNSLDNIKNSIDKVESTMDVGNFIQIIQTYQMYKVNKNTKSLRS